MNAPTGPTIFGGSDILENFVRRYKGIGPYRMEELIVPDGNYSKASNEERWFDFALRLMQAELPADWDEVAQIHEYVTVCTVTLLQSQSLGRVRRETVQAWADKQVPAWFDKRRNAFDAYMHPPAGGARRVPPWYGARHEYLEQKWTQWMKEELGFASTLIPPFVIPARADVEWFMHRVRNQDADAVKALGKSANKPSIPWVDEPYKETGNGEVSPTGVQLLIEQYLSLLLAAMHVDEDVQDSADSPDGIFEEASLTADERFRQTCQRADYVFSVFRSLCVPRPAAADALTVNLKDHAASISAAFPQWTRGEMLEAVLYGFRLQGLFLVAPDETAVNEDGMCVPDPGNRERELDCGALRASVLHDSEAWEEAHPGAPLPNYIDDKVAVPVPANVPSAKDDADDDDGNVDEVDETDTDNKYDTIRRDWVALVTRKCGFDREPVANAFRAVVPNGVTFVRRLPMVMSPSMFALIATQGHAAKNPKLMLYLTKFDERPPVPGMMWPAITSLRARYGLATDDEDQDDQEADDFIEQDDAGPDGDLELFPAHLRYTIHRYYVQNQPEEHWHGITDYLTDLATYALQSAEAIGTLLPFKKRAAASDGKLRLPSSYYAERPNVPAANFAKRPGLEPTTDAGLTGHELVELLLRNDVGADEYGMLVSKQVTSFSASYQAPADTPVTILVARKKVVSATDASAPTTPASVPPASVSPASAPSAPASVPSASVPSASVPSASATSAPASVLPAPVPTASAVAVGSAERFKLPVDPLLGASDGGPTAVDVPYTTADLIAWLSQKGVNTSDIDKATNKRIATLRLLMPRLQEFVREHPVSDDMLPYGMLRRPEGRAIGKWIRAGVLTIDQVRRLMPRGQTVETFVKRQNGSLKDTDEGLVSALELYLARTGDAGAQIALRQLAQMVVQNIWRGIQLPGEVWTSKDYNQWRTAFTERFFAFVGPELDELRALHLGCDPKASAKRDLRNYQRLQQYYFTPIASERARGQLLRWSVGSGKTCGVLAALANFYKQDLVKGRLSDPNTRWRYLWVSRKSMLSIAFADQEADCFWQNVGAKQPASLRPGRGSNATENDSRGRPKLSTIIERMSFGQLYRLLASYKRISGIKVEKGDTKDESEMREFLGEAKKYSEERRWIRNPNDPLYRTVVVVDEVQLLHDRNVPNSEYKLWGPNPGQRILQGLKTMLYNSYKVSDAQSSARVILSTATPQDVDDPMLGIKLLNMLMAKPEGRQPENLQDFAALYFNDAWTDLKANAVREQFLPAVRGTVSYVENDNIGEFAPLSSLIVVPVPMTRGQWALVNDCLAAGTNKARKSAKDLIDAANKLEGNAVESIDVTNLDVAWRNSGHSSTGVQEQPAYEGEELIAAVDQTCNPKDKNCADVQDPNACATPEGEGSEPNNPNNHREILKRMNCMRNAMMWGAAGRAGVPSFPQCGMLLDSDNFDNTKASYQGTELAKHSPKLAKVLQTIEEIDRQDLAQTGKLFKHSIYSVLSTSWGSKLIASAMAANGYQECFVEKAADGKTWQVVRSEKNRLPDGTVNKGNFVLITTGAYHNAKKRPTDTPTMGPRVATRSVSPNTAQEMLNALNKADNAHGELVRFIILGSAFMTGVSLLDVVHGHLMEVPLTDTETLQEIGRFRRLCGSRNLGWKHWGDKAGGESWKPADVHVYKEMAPDATSGFLVQDGAGAPKTETGMALLRRIMRNITPNSEKATLLIARMFEMAAFDFDLNKVFTSKVWRELLAQMHEHRL